MVNKMSKYYNKKIPIEINFVYGGRHYGKTYREFEKLKARIKQLEEHNKELIETNYNLATKKTKFEEELNKLRSDYSNVVTECEKLNSKAKNYEDLYNTLMTRCNKLIKYIDSLEEDELIKPIYANHIRDIMQSGF